MPWNEWMVMMAAGLVLGGLYFAGLWWTLERLGRWRQPAVGLGVSFLVRAALLMTALLGITGGRPFPIIAALMGFWVSRFIFCRAWGGTHSTKPTAASLPEGDL